MPIIDENIKESEGNTNIALRLIFRNPDLTFDMNEYALVEHTFTFDELYKDENLGMSFSLLGSGVVHILYQEGMLIIKTHDIVDVILSGYTPAIGIHVETPAAFGIVDGPSLHLQVGMYVKAHRIIVDLPVVCDDFLTLISNNDVTSRIQLGCPVVADKLKLDTNNLLLESNLIVNAATIRSKKLSTAKYTIMQIGEGSYIPLEHRVHHGPIDGIINLQNSKQNSDENNKNVQNEENDKVFPLACNTWRMHVLPDVFRNKRSIIIVDEMTCEGIFRISNAEVSVKNQLRFFDDCDVRMSNTHVFSDSVRISKKGKVTGSNVCFKLLDKLDVDGVCNIDGLTIISPNLTANTFLWRQKGFSFIFKPFPMAVMACSFILALVGLSFALAAGAILPSALGILGVLSVAAAYFAPALVYNAAEYQLKKELLEKGCVFDARDKSLGLCTTLNQNPLPEMYEEYPVEAEESTYKMAGEIPKPMNFSKIRPYRVKTADKIDPDSGDFSSGLKTDPEYRLRRKRMARSYI